MSKTPDGEENCCYKHKDFSLLSEKAHFTDDTVMTVAVAVGLIDGKGLPERAFGAVEHERTSPAVP